MLKLAQNQRKFQNQVFTENEYLTLLPSLRAIQNILWNIHNPGFYRFLGIYVLLQDINKYRNFGISTLILIIPSVDKKKSEGINSTYFSILVFTNNPLTLVVLSHFQKIKNNPRGY